MRRGESRGQKAACRQWAVKVVVEGKLFGNRKWKGEAVPEKGKEDGFKEERLFLPKYRQGTCEHSKGRKGWNK